MVDSGRVGKRTKEALVDGLKWLVNDASLGDVLFFFFFFGVFFFFFFFGECVFCFFYFVCLSATLLVVGQVEIIIMMDGRCVRRMGAKGTRLIDLKSWWNTL